MIRLRREGPRNFGRLVTIRMALNTDIMMAMASWSDIRHVSCYVYDVSMSWIVTLNIEESIGKAVRELDLSGWQFRCVMVHRGYYSCHQVCEE